MEPESTGAEGGAAVKDREVETQGVTLGWDMSPLRGYVASSALGLDAAEPLARRLEAGL